MTEIELKAHVQNRTELIQKLNSIAEYRGHFIRNDEYYGLRDKNGSLLKNKIRIRKEESDTAKKILLTYKHKEEHSAGKTVMEVNDEKECELSDDEAVKCFLTDFGFELSLRKHKDVFLWSYEGISLELCTVPPLGDFLELELLSPEDTAEIREKSHKRLEELLLKCGIPSCNIENRYYSDLLREEAEKTKD